MKRVQNDLPTSRQLDALQAVVRLTTELGRPPSYAEMGAALKLSRTAARDLLLSCEGKGLAENREVVDLSGWRVTAAGKKWL